VALLRYVSSSSLLPYDTRRQLYYRLGKKARLPADQVFEHRVDGGAVVRLRAEGTIRQLYWTGAFELDALPLFVEYARGTNCILDVGAAEGVYSLFAAAVAPTARIVAFEPGGAQVERLRQNIALNSTLGSRITIAEVALSDRDGEADFYELPGGTSSLNPAFRADTTTRTVKVARGDGIVDGLTDDARVDLVKIDTESTEPAVISGLSDTLARDHPVIFCEVLKGRTEERLQKLVDELDYDTWWLSGSGPVRRQRIAGEVDFVNWLFLPRGSQPKVLAGH
jgi:FkbM family methyltransferase